MSRSDDIPLPFKISLLKPLLACSFSSAMNNAIRRSFKALIFPALSGFSEMVLKMKGDGRMFSDVLAPVHFPQLWSVRDRIFVH